MWCYEPSLTTQFEFLYFHPESSATSGIAGETKALVSELKFLKTISENEILCALKKCEPSRRPSGHLVGCKRSNSSGLVNLIHSTAGTAEKSFSASGGGQSSKGEKGGVCQVTSDVCRQTSTDRTIAGVAEFYERELISTIEWAKQVPGEKSYIFKRDIIFYSFTIMIFPLK